ncbi:bifunctional ADP-dependent NAD(P)H-hydrate dehydratase/NAD(P)H-hydrate epimerase [soil metagenome]
MWIATADRILNADRRAMDEFGVPAKVLMERAGMAVFAAIKEMLPEGGRLTVLCGKGNNGSDGFVFARLAKEDGRYQVDCLVAAKEEELGGLCAEQLRIARAQGVQPVFYDDARWVKRCEHMSCRDLIVDALLGVGAKGEVRGAVKEAISAINRSGVPVVAVDVPSGIATDTGEELGESVWALRTVTFSQPKPFLFQGVGIDHSGCWEVEDIGVPKMLVQEPTDARLLTRDVVANLVPERMRGAHKGDSGSVLIIAGSRGFRGAAVLAARAALRSGAGLVTVASIGPVVEAVAAQLPEALVLELPEEDGAIAESAVEAVLKAKFHAAVIGPGLSMSVKPFLARLFPRWDRPTVLDADALNVIGEGLRPPGTECVMTPHPGEMSRLLRLSVAEIQADRFQTMRQATERFGKTMLLKGPYSLVAEPDQPLLVNHTGNPGMATGGMGDVLSGVIGTLLAQELPPYWAAGVGMHWHGAAADLCAEKIGETGYTAGEVADALPQARSKLLSECEPR